VLAVSGGGITVKLKDSGKKLTGVSPGNLAPVEYDEAED